MPKVSDMKGVPVLGFDGRELGSVADVLFDPHDPRVVGFLVDPPRVARVIKPKQRFAPWPLEGQVVAGDAVRLDANKLLGPRAASKILGHDWETTVVWRDMPVVGPGGMREGTVKDVGFGRSTGVVRSITVTAGAARDAAVGATVIDGEHVTGFDGHAVLVTTEGFMTGEVAGGAAQIAGAGAAYVKVKGEHVVDQANKALEESAIVKAAARAYDPAKVGKGLGRMIGQARKAATHGIEHLEKRQGRGD